MLHEYRDEIRELKQTNAHFEKIFIKHNELDQKIKDALEGRLFLSDLEIEKLKKEKLKLKYEAFHLILEYKKSKEG